jgi:hypothetical protein
VRRPASVDVVICAAIGLFAAWVTGGLWPDPAGRALALNPGDQALDEWFLAHATRLYSGDFQLVTHLLNAPDGVNLLSNASLIALGVIMAPVTLAFGAPVSFAFIMTANLAATGIGWYLVLARTLGLHRLGAAVGGAFVAFAPGMVSQANAHLHMTAQWLVPVIVWCVIKLARVSGDDRPLLRVLSFGGFLGLVIAGHLFLGEEVLFLAAIGLAVFSIAYAAVGPRAARQALPGVAGGLAVAAAVAVALLSYPLWLQFAGPQSVPNGPFNAAFFSADLAAFTSISPLSLAGDDNSARLVSSAAEYTSFFGWPLVLVTVGAALWMWRRPAVLASAITAVLMCGLALGPQIVIDRERTEHSGPYALLASLPVVDSALPTRFALAAVPPIAIILATAIHVALTESRTFRLLVPVAIVAALVPLAPAPLPVQERTPAPRFFTEGYWRGCVRPGGVLVPVPIPDGGDANTMRWAAAANAEFGIPQGWFIGPYAAGGRASVGIYPRATASLLNEVAKTGQARQITETERSTAATDIAYWGASCVALAADHQHVDALKSTVDGLFGPGERVADVWIWRV